ncbi:aldehyde ferredoxin oxidoreductase family protein [Thermodesulfobacteriota bacterium]
MNFIRVNMNDKTVKVEAMPDEYFGIGGRGLTSIMINNEVPADCDPLGPDNKLIFATGMFCGTSMFNSSRVSVGAKSPLTGGIKEANVGGTAGTAIGKLGIAAIIVDGKADEGDLSILKLDLEGNAELIDAGAYKGMRTYELVEKLHAEYGEKNSVLCIGPAGEYNMKSASIQSSDTDKRPCRAAGRGGMGAVMGSKGLKAVIIPQGGKKADPVVDKEAFSEATKAFAELIKANPFEGELLPNFGTPALVAPVNLMGAFPSYNATKGEFEGWQKISGEALANTIKERGGQTGHVGCSQCIIRCSNVFNDKDGKYVSSSVEYETIWSMGGMTGIDDLDTIARLDFLCDDIGLDTMNTGVAIAVAMDSGYKEFGDKEGAVEIMEEIAKGSEIGHVFGNGPVSVGAHFNNPRIAAVKNQSIAAYDPRGMIGNGITYATSPMGADHTSGNMVALYLGHILDPLKKEGQIENSRANQIFSAAADSMGLCLFAMYSVASPDAQEMFIKLVNARLGSSWTVEDLPSLGIRILKAEKEFNKKAGLTKDDDRLPEFFYKEPLPPHNVVFPFTEEEIDSTHNF